MAHSKGKNDGASANARDLKPPPRFGTWESGYPWWGFIYLGVFFIGFAFFQDYVLAQAEARSDRISMEAIIAPAYQLAGKPGVFAFICFVGVLNIWYGINLRLQMSKQDNESK